jgi:hypothetical protein
MSQRKGTTRPKIHDIKWRKDGYGTQVIWLSSYGTCNEWNDGPEYAAKDSIQRGYVKVWFHGKFVGPLVVDRALTVTAAEKMIARRKAAMANFY